MTKYVSKLNSHLYKMLEKYIRYFVLCTAHKYSDNMPVPRGFHILNVIIQVSQLVIYLFFRKHTLY